MQMELTNKGSSEKFFVKNFKGLTYEKIPKFLQYDKVQAVYRYFSLYAACADTAHLQQFLCNQGNAKSGCSILQGYDFALHEPNR